MKLQKTTAQAVIFLGVYGLPMLAGTIDVNNSCLAGPCSSPDVLNYGQSVSDPFSFVYTLANTDQYQVSGVLASQNTSTPNGGGAFLTNAANVNLTYLGNSSGTASRADTLVVDLNQEFQSAATGYGLGGSEAVGGNFGGLLSDTTTVSSVLLSENGTSMQTMGPFSPPVSFFESLDNQLYLDSSPTTLVDYKDSILIGSGSGVGASVTINDAPFASSVPEPATGPLLGLVVSFFGFCVWTRRRE